MKCAGASKMWKTKAENNLDLEKSQKNGVSELSETPFFYSFRSKKADLTNFGKNNRLNKTEFIVNLFPLLNDFSDHFNQSNFLFYEEVFTRAGYAMF